MADDNPPDIPVPPDYPRFVAEDAPWSPELAKWVEYPTNYEAFEGWLEGTWGEWARLTREWSQHGSWSEEKMEAAAAYLAFVEARQREDLWDYAPEDDSGWDGALDEALPEGVRQRMRALEARFPVTASASDSPSLPAGQETSSSAPVPLHSHVSDVLASLFGPPDALSTPSAASPAVLAADKSVVPRPDPPPKTRSEAFQEVPPCWGDGPFPSTHPLASYPVSPRDYKYWLRETGKLFRDFNTAATPTDWNGQAVEAAARWLAFVSLRAFVWQIHPDPATIGWSPLDEFPETVQARATALYEEHRPGYETLLAEKSPENRPYSPGLSVYRERISRRSISRHVPPALLTLPINRLNAARLVMLGESMWRLELTLTRAIIRLRQGEAAPPKEFIPVLADIAFEWRSHHVYLGPIAEPLRFALAFARQRYPDEYRKFRWRIAFGTRFLEKAFDPNSRTAQLIAILGASPPDMPAGLRKPVRAFERLALSFPGFRSTQEAADEMGDWMTLAAEEVISPFATALSAKRSQPFHNFLHAACRVFLPLLARYQVVRGEDARIPWEILEQVGRASPWPYPPTPSFRSDGFPAQWRYFVAHSVWLINTALKSAPEANASKEQWGTWVAGLRPLGTAVKRYADLRIGYPLHFSESLSTVIDALERLQKSRGIPPPEWVSAIPAFLLRKVKADGLLLGLEPVSDADSTVSHISHDSRDPGRYFERDLESVLVDFDAPGQWLDIFYPEPAVPRPAKRARSSSSPPATPRAKRLATPKSPPRAVPWQLRSGRKYPSAPAPEQHAPPPSDSDSAVPSGDEWAGPSSDTPDDSDADADENTDSDEIVEISARFRTPDAEANSGASSASVSSRSPTPLRKPATTRRRPSTATTTIPSRDMPSSNEPSVFDASSKQPRPIYVGPPKKVPSNLAAPVSGLTADAARSPHLLVCPYLPALIDVSKDAFSIATVEEKGFVRVVGADVGGRKGRDLLFATGIYACLLCHATQKSSWSGLRRVCIRFPGHNCLKAHDQDVRSTFFNSQFTEIPFDHWELLYDRGVTKAQSDDAKTLYSSKFHRRVERLLFPGDRGQRELGRVIAPWDRPTPGLTYATLPRKKKSKGEAPVASPSPVSVRVPTPVAGPSGSSSRKRPAPESSPVPEAESSADPSANEVLGVALDLLEALRSFIDDGRATTSRDLADVFRHRRVTKLGMQLDELHALADSYLADRPSLPSDRA